MPIILPIRTIQVIRVYAYPLICLPIVMGLIKTVVAEYRWLLTTPFFPSDVCGAIGYNLHSCSYSPSNSDYTSGRGSFMALQVSLAETVEQVSKGDQY